jgi:hypothetical protein
MKTELNAYNRFILSALVEKADEINNYADCDVIQEAKQQVLNATTPQELKDGAEYLLVACCYRTGDGNQIVKYMRSITDEITTK